MKNLQKLDREIQFLELELVCKLNEKEQPSFLEVAQVGRILKRDRVIRNVVEVYC